jgi:hypothetical protein
MHAYERQAYEMAGGKYTPMGEARIYERHAYEMAPVSLTAGLTQTVPIALRMTGIYVAFTSEHKRDKRSILPPPFLLWLVCI